MYASIALCVYTYNARSGDAAGTAWDSAIAVPYGQDSLSAFGGLSVFLNENLLSKLLRRIVWIRVAEEPYVG